jgi:hypothetical protein
VGKRWTKTEAFAAFGAKCRNARWSWSARSPDAGVVVLTFWKDFFNPKTKPATYDDTRWEELGDPNAPGNRERIENIKLAVERHGGVVSVVIAVAKDVEKAPREIEECYPQKNLKMRITEFNEKTGMFRAEVVDGQNANVSA